MESRAWPFAGLIAALAVAAAAAQPPMFGPLDNTTPIKYFIADGSGASGYRASDRQLAVWAFEAWQLSAYLDVQNVYNHENVEATQYDYRFEDSVPITGIPILPTLGVRGTW